ncbi:MAG: hypothetical protein EBU82_13275, partial [Flavobacteriia bacterium]|nr:hypothetical protein [Flavobacteriia bacterium]
IDSLTVGQYVVTITDSNNCSFVSQTINITQPTPLTVNHTTQGAACFNQSNGSATFTVSGGSPSYSLSWTGPLSGSQANAIPNNGGSFTVTNLAPGTYTFTISDNGGGCTTTQSVTIANPPQLTVSQGITNVNCFGQSTGSVVLNVQGGTPHNGNTHGYNVLYTGPNNLSVNPNGYEIVPAAGVISGSYSGMSNLSTGTYSYTVTDLNGCSVTNSVTITQPQSPLQLSSLSSNNLCPNASTGSINLTPLGGTQPYSYLWTNGATVQDPTNLPAGNYTVTVTDANNCQQQLTTSVSAPTAFQLTAVISNVTCHNAANGSINLSVSGGTLAYSYLWNNGSINQDIGPVAPGSYSVTVTDANNCSTQATYAITQPQAPLTLSTTQVNVSCNGASTGSINLTVSGGTAAYSYVWSNGSTGEDLTGLPAGTYSVTVTDANGCNTTTSISITQTSSIVSNLSVAPVQCNAGQDGSLNFTASGGNGTLFYSTNPPSITGTVAIGNNNIPNLSAGNYTLLIADAFGCSGSFPFVVNTPQPISINATAVQITCNGFNNGAINITSISGGTAPYNFVWNNGASTQSISGLSAGNYNVTITDNNNCTYAQSWMINNQPPLLIPALDTVIQVVCNGQNTGEILIDVIGGTPPYNYNWTSLGGGNFQSSNQDIINLSPGSYSVTVTDNNGCVSNLGPFNLSIPSPILYSVSTQNVQCNGASNGSIDLTPSGGIGPYTYAWSNGSSNEDLLLLPSGVYNVIITDANQCFTSASITITE